MQDKSIARWVVSHYAWISWNAGRMEIWSPALGKVFRTENPDVLRLVNAFVQARSIEEVLPEIVEYPSEEVSACIRELIYAGILMSASEADPIAAHHWERSALAFHKTSRSANPPSTRSHKTAAVARGESSRTILLGCPSHLQRHDFSEVLESRCSRRVWSEEPIAREIFSSLLWMSARNRDLERDATSAAFVSRPYPSGGAAYSLELYAILAPGAVTSIAAGVYRYLPDSHGLEMYSGESAACIPFLEAAGRSAASGPPPIVLIITSRFARQSELYGDLAYSLVLKEVGALLQTLYLVAENLGLAACAIGGGTPDHLLLQLLNTTEFAEPVVGEFMIGPRRIPQHP
jgi:SagB-type dehydrogenase family enzyme